MEEFGDPRDIARMTRAHWGMPRGPVNDLVQTLEAAGIIVVMMDFETSRVDAIGRWIPGLPPIFCVNQNIPKDRLRFTLAHELGHMIMHDAASPEMEDEANVGYVPGDYRAAEIDLALGRAAGNAPGG